MFAGELEVEGDLNVSGEVQSPTIEALLAQIAALEAQIALLQGIGNSEISGRIIEMEVPITAGYVEHTLLLNEITGESQDWYRLSFISGEFSDNDFISMDCDVEFGVHGIHEIDNDLATPNDSQNLARRYNGNIELESSGASHFMISDSNPKFGVKTNYCTINGGGYWTGTVTLKFLADSNFN